jgi:dynein heavy chain
MYDGVLARYEVELNEMEELFERGKKDPPISKNMPPKAGCIAWARSIMGRIRAPIQKFKSKSDRLRTETFTGVAYKYVKLAKELDKNYEQNMFDDWRKQNTEKAIRLLQENILVGSKVAD